MGIELPPDSDQEPPHVPDDGEGCGGRLRSGGRELEIVIEEGGHTWPGQKPPVGSIGKSAKNISANDLMWEFFQKHKLK